MKKKRKAGRPPKKKADKQTARISVYITESEAKKIRADSAEAGLTPGAYLAEIWRLHRMAKEE